MATAQAPVGTVAMLVTDIEGSTDLARRLGDRWPAVLADHHAIVADAIARHGGHVDGTEGDAFFAVFTDTSAAIAAAVAAQRELAGHPWPEPVRVRMGIHTGHVDRRPTGYVGLEVHRAARIAAAAHGGQLIVSTAARALAGDEVAFEELGRHRLKDFPAAEQLWCAVIDGAGAAAFPPPRALDVRPTNLPSVRVRVVGREADVDRTCAALAEDRLVSLVGRGGTGKTTLALTVGDRLLGRFAGGVWWVPLATLDAAGVGPAARAVLRDGDARPALLVLDNFEHVTAAAAEVAALLAEAPHVHALVTSQVPLRIGGERVIALDELDAGAAEALLRDRAERAGVPPAVLEDPAVGDLLAVLDGLPLAIELAAPRLRLLGPAALTERLRASSSALKGGGADLPERQRSLRATIAWTLEHLDPAARALFTRLGAFAAPVGLDELELVLGDDEIDVVDALAGLLDFGILRRVDGDEPRFGLPEAIRQVAEEELDAAPDGARWRRRHAERQRDIAWAVRGEACSWAADYARAQAGEAEIRLALRWTAAHAPELWSPIAAPFACVLSGIGRVREAAALAADALERCEDPTTRSVALTARLHVAAVGGERLGDWREVAAQVRELEGADPMARVLAVMMEAMMRCTAGDAGGLPLHESAATAAAEVSPAAWLCARVMHAQSLMFLGHPAQAGAMLEESLARPDVRGAKIERHVDTVRGDIALVQQDYDEAVRSFVRSLKAAEERGDELQVFFDLVCLSATLAEQGRHRDALEIDAMARAHAADNGVAFTSAVGAGHYERRVAAARAAVDPATLAEAQAAGAAVPAGLRGTRARALAAAS